MRSDRVFNIFLVKLVSFEWSQNDERVFDHVTSLYTEKILDHTEDNEQYWNEQQNHCYTLLPCVKRVQ